MNALYNHAVKQKTLLQRDLSRFEKDLVTAPISLQGSISTTLISLEKTINQYKDYLAKYNSSTPADSEETQIKYQSRLDSLQQVLAESNEKFLKLKKEFNETNAREQLLKSSSNPFDEENVMNRRNVAVQSSAQAQTSSSLPLYEGLQKEQSIFERGNAQLDYILEMGQQSLEDIVEQNAVLQKVQQTMTKSLHTLGVSNETIEKINKRVFKDKFIFWIALILMFLGFYFLLKLFR